MSSLSPEEREMLERRLEEIDTKLLDLSYFEFPLEERAKLRLKLTREWLAILRKLIGGP